MKIYLAAPWTHREEARIFGECLEGISGVVITEHWWNHTNVVEYPDFDAVMGSGPIRQDLLNQAQLDLKGVVECDLFIVLQLDKSEGKAFETGVAVALSKPIMVLLPERKFGNLFQVMAVDAKISYHFTLENVFEVVKARARFEELSRITLLAPDSSEGVK